MKSIEDETLESYTERDIISSFPDSILIHILSLLPTKYSVRTSALSTRWYPLYTSLPVLHFPDYPPDPSFATKLSHVSKILIRHSMLCSALDVLPWIQTALSHNVQEFDLSVEVISFPPLPHAIFTCQTLLSLTLDARYVFTILDEVYLPKLKRLYLKQIVLSNESDDRLVSRLLSGCPVLESLTIDSWWMNNSRVLDVTVTTLKCLVVILPRVSCEYMLVINCPELEILRVEGYAVGGYGGSVVGSIKKVYIDIEMFEERLFNDGKLVNLAKLVSKAQFLSLAGDSMRALMKPPGALCTFDNLTHLELRSFYCEGWKLLPSLLGSSPRLETLVLPMGFCGRDHNIVPFSPPEHVPHCLLFHLKVIRMNKFCGDEDEYKYVEYFLMNGMVMEKMEISLWSSEDAEEGNDPNEGDMEVEMEGEGEEQGQGEGRGEGEGEDEGEGEGEDEDEGESEGEEDEDEGESEGEEEHEEEFDVDLERHFEITKRLLTFQRFSEVCQVDIISPHDEDDK